MAFTTMKFTTIYTRIPLPPLFYSWQPAFLSPSPSWYSRILNRSVDLRRGNLKDSFSTRPSSLWTNKKSKNKKKKERNHRVYFRRIYPKELIIIFLHQLTFRPPIVQIISRAIDRVPLLSSIWSNNLPWRTLYTTGMQRFCWEKAPKSLVNSRIDSSKYPR